MLQLPSGRVIYMCKSGAGFNSAHGHQKKIIYNKNIKHDASLLGIQYK